jgi:sortase A
MVRTVFRGFGELCVTAGVILLLFIAYLFWGTAWRADSAQSSLSAQLNQEWAHQGGTSGSSGQGSVIDLVTGEPFAFIEIPAFGKNWKFTIIQGTALAQLNVSPGHVPGTQLPGQLGNFAVAGHRVTAGNPFWSLPSMRAGDVVDVETIAGTYEYVVTGKPQWVAPGDSAVLAPVPGHPGQAPSRRMITLITCDPPWSGTSRVIVTGVLVRLLPRQQGIEG